MTRGQKHRFAGCSHRGFGQYCHYCKQLEEARRIVNTQAGKEEAKKLGIPVLELAASKLGMVSEAIKMKGGGDGSPVIIGYQIRDKAKLVKVLGLTESAAQEEA